MRKFITLIFTTLIVLTAFNSKAQTLKIDTTQISFENKLRPAIGAMVEPEPDLLKKAWKSYMKKNFGAKVDGIGFLQNKEMLTASDVTINKISDKRMNIYARVTEITSGSEIKVFASFGYDFFIGQTNYPKEYDALQSIVSEFLQQNLNEFYNDEIKETSKRIKDLDKEKIGLLKSIEKNNKKAVELSDDIVELSGTQKTNTEQSIKSVEKISKFSTEKTALENKSREATVSILQIDEELISRKVKLEKLKAKHDNLILNQ